MNFSENYLYENFRKNYEEALAANKKGNLAAAKDKFVKAADFLDKLAFLANGSEREKYSEQATRLKNIAAAIVAEKSANGDNSKSVGERGEKPEADDGVNEFFTFYTPDKINCGFEGVIGLESAKQAITEYIINPVRYPEAYNYNFLNNKSVLLEGPPGTGKTTFAKAVAKEVNRPFALINVGGLVNCYMGETGKNIDKIFSYLRDYVEKNNCGVTVFFDELDEIAKSRGGDDKTSEASVPALLRNLDGVKDNKNFLILANTNRKDVLDRAVLERFRQQIYVPLPDGELRKNLFKAKLDDVENEFREKLDFDDLSERSEGLSGRDITFVCDDFKYFIAKIKAKIIEREDVHTHMVQLISARLQSKQTSG